MGKNPWEDAEQDEVSPDNPLLAPSNSDSLGMELTDNRNLRTQAQWIDYFKEVREMTRKGVNAYLPSMPEFYLQFKGIATGIEDGVTGVEWAARTIREAISGVPIATCTWAQFKEDRLESTLFHGHENPDDIDAVVRSYDTVIWPYNSLENEARKPLPSEFADAHTLHYLGALFDTKDIVTDIIEVFTKTFDIEAGKISLWAPTQAQRQTEYTTGVATIRYHDKDKELVIGYARPLDKIAAIHTERERS